MSKKIKILFATLLLSVLFGVPVLAASMDFVFDVDLSDDLPNVEYSDNTLKTDNDEYARISYYNSNITVNDDFCFYVVGQKGNTQKYTNPLYVNANTGTYYPWYNNPDEIYCDNYYRLAGQTYAYQVHVEGNWAP